MNQDTISTIITKLKTAPYEQALGVRVVELSETEIANKNSLLIAIQIDAGKELVPHLHEFDGEICIAVTEGIVYLGDAQKDNGSYKINTENKVMVRWETEKAYKPGESFIIPAKKAHHFEAKKDKDFILLIFLPKTHLGEDRKFVTHP